MGDGERARHSTSITRVLKKPDDLQAEGWIEAFTNGSANRMGGWSQAAFGCYYRERNHSKLFNFVPVDEPKTKNRAETRAVLHVFV